MSLITHNAYKRAALILKCLHTRDQQTLKLAFCTYVRPLLEFASQIWSPGYSYLINSIEKVTRRFTKQIPGVRHILSGTPKAIKYSLPSIEFEHLHADLIWCFKIVFVYVDVHRDDYLEFCYESLSR